MHNSGFLKLWLFLVMRLSSPTHSNDLFKTDQKRYHFAMLLWICYLASYCSDRLRCEIISRLLTWIGPSGMFLASSTVHLVCLFLFWFNSKQLNKRMELSGGRCWLSWHFWSLWPSVSVENKCKTRGSVPSMSFSLTRPCPHSFRQHASVCYLCDRNDATGLPEASLKWCVTLITTVMSWPGLRSQMSVLC